MTATCKTMSHAAKLEVATRYVAVGFIDADGFAQLTGLPRPSDEWVASMRKAYEDEMEHEAKEEGHG